MRKNNLKSFQILPPTTNNMTGTSTLTSSVTDIRFLDDIGIQFDWTGSPTGTFQIEVSANYDANVVGSSSASNTGTWVPLTFTYWNGTSNVTSATLPTTLGTPIYVDLALLSAPWIRIQYTNSTGTGTLTATITAKAVG